MWTEKCLRKANRQEKKMQTKSLLKFKWSAPISSTWRCAANTSHLKFRIIILNWGLCEHDISLLLFIIICTYFLFEKKKQTNKQPDANNLACISLCVCASGLHFYRFNCMEASKQARRYTYTRISVWWSVNDRRRVSEWAKEYNKRRERVSEWVRICF